MTNLDIALYTIVGLTIAVAVIAFIRVALKDNK